MLTDTLLRLAEAEAVPHGGAIPGGLAGNTISGVAGTPKWFDLQQGSSPGGLTQDQLSNTKLEMRVRITTALGITDPRSFVEFQLVTMPILPTLLTAATTSGRLTHITGVTISLTGNGVVTLANHGLALGTPVYFSAGSGGAEFVQNTTYYVIPLTANTFAFASTFADALAGNQIELTVTAWTGTTIEFVPRVHLTTGAIQAQYLAAGVMLSGRTIIGPMSGAGQARAPYAGATPTPVGMAQHLGTNTGGSAGGYVPSVGRFLVPRVLVSGLAAGTAGRYSLDLGLATGSGDRYHSSGFQAL